MINSMTRSVITAKKWYRSMLAGNASAVPAYDLISTTILGSSQASVSFDVTGLGSTYKHLQIRMVGRTARTDLGIQSVRLTFNSDGGSNYYSHELSGNGSSISSGGGADVFMVPGYLSTNASSTNANGVFIADILDVFSTSKNKTMRSLSGMTSNNNISFHSGVWLNTAALTTLSMVTSTGATFNAGSRFSIYGIKG